jgi:hypothetical protein
MEYSSSESQVGDRDGEGMVGVKSQHTSHALKLAECVRGPTPAVPVGLKFLSHFPHHFENHCKDGCKSCHIKSVMIMISLSLTLAVTYSCLQNYVENTIEKSAIGDCWGRTPNVLQHVWMCDRHE